MFSCHTWGMERWGRIQEGDDKSGKGEGVEASKFIGVEKES